MDTFTIIIFSLPLVVLVLIIVIFKKLDKKRTEGFKKAALQLGFTYSETADLLPELSPLKLFTKGH